MGWEGVHIHDHLASLLTDGGTADAGTDRDADAAATYLEHAIEPTDQLALPYAKCVMTLSVERTFWGKATLIHAELGRPDRDLKARYARHWYDLHRLSTHATIGPQVLSAAPALAQVIDIKTKQFRSGGARYEDCGRGKLLLVPNGALRTQLRNDFQKMQASGMFLAEPPQFNAIIDQLRDLEITINATYSATPAV